MPDLSFHLDGVEPVPYAAVPQLAFKLRIAQSVAGEQPLNNIHNVLLRCQIRIDPGKRRYSPAEQQNLNELFGEPHRWGQTLRSMLWTNVISIVPAFTTDCRTDLLVPCSFDFNVAATKYFAALREGDLPLSFLFSGTIFYATADQALQADQISWEREAAIRLPIETWRQMMQIYYPGVAWLCLRQDVFDRLNDFKRAQAMHSLDQAIESLLAGSDSLASNGVKR